MGHLVYTALLCALSLSYSHGCDMGPVGTPWIPQTITITDTYRGNMFTIETRNIAGIADIGGTQNLNGGPYFGASLVDSQFTLYTIDSSFDDYEENEVTDNTSVTVLFNCVGGTTRSLTLLIFITDTNNNAPQFIPSNELEFTLIPPLPPGFSITGCFDDITVRDIDLTTQRIDFEIFDTTLFEISYDAESSTVPKEFKASLRTRTFIRSIPEPIVFRISATDIDLTEGPPITTYATVRITSSNDGFELPDEPVFTQAYYLATYTEDHLVVLEAPIALQQGDNAQVMFTLDQGTTQHFEIQRNGTEISLQVVTPLTADLLAQRQILLVINAAIENTSGSRATIIVELPKEEDLQFAHPTYEGAIVDNVLQLSQLVISQGNPISIEIISEHSSFFQATLTDNIINVTMSPLPQSVIESTAFLNLLVVAATNRTSTSTVVTLQIVTDDTATPVFERAVYEGLYNDGLSLEQIVLVQGYDETVRVSLHGEYSSYFELNQDGSSMNLTLTAPSLPTELFREPNLLLYLQATKPRTVGATTAISILLPAEIQLEFEQQYYRGVIEDNVLQLSELVLSRGYEEETVSVAVRSEHSTFFSAAMNQNRITLNMLPLDITTIEQNTFLNLEVVASTNRSTASTIVTLEIVKDDSVTPVFDRVVYEGHYDPIKGLALVEIAIIQGYDDSVNVTLRGEYSSYFEIVRQGPLINLTASSLPPELFSEQNIIISIEATKPRTVGASVAVSIALAAEIQLEFAQVNYVGVIRDNSLELTELILRQGYDSGPVSVNINNNDYAPYFDTAIDSNRISLSMSALNSNITEANTFINLEVIASTSWSSAVTVVTLEVIKNDTITPVFGRTMYTGSYDPEEGLRLEQIVIVQGYDDTVQVVLEGEHASLFQLAQQGPNINITVASSLPSNLLTLPGLLLTLEATKPRTIGANTAIAIAFPEARDMRFAAETYSGTIQENLLDIENIVLNVGYTEDVVFSLSGEYASYFNVTNVENQITVGLRALIPDSAIEENNFLLLTLSASALNAVTATTSIAIDIIKGDLTTPVFAQNMYFGTYVGPSSISIGTISLTQGFDNTVTFSLVGEHSHYFRPSVSASGEVLLELHSAIPEEVIFNEKVLLFSILAEKELTVGANAAVSINFPRELTEPSVLRFARNVYVGSLQENILDLEDIVLETGYVPGTDFQLTGEFSQYFTWNHINNVLQISALNSLPTEILNRKFISLELEARRTRAVSVVTTILIDIEDPKPEVAPVVVPPVFIEAFYTGVYTSENGLQFDNEISLSEGFDDTVSFALEGESSQWFDITQNNGTVQIITRGTIPLDVVEANHHLLFSILAQKPNATDGRAAISIDLPKETIIEQALSFDQISYVGSIANETITLSPIILAEGPTTGVTYTLNGSQANYFRVTSQGTTVTVALQGTIPEDSIPLNRIIVLEIQASAPQTISGFATIVLHVIVDEDTPPAAAELAFDATYYVGSYTTNAGLELNTPIILAEGYGRDVVFALEGDNSQWFTVRNLGNVAILELSGIIPPAVIANNQKLIFAIRAQTPDGAATRATIVISLTAETTNGEVLGFDRLSYVGSIANNTVNLDPIVLAGGPHTGVTYTLHGQLANNFIVTSQGAIVTVALQGTIPEESISPNRLIILELQASAPQATPAYATIVLHVIVDDDTPPATTDLAFDATYYVGSYTANDGLVLNSPITLTEGYSSNVAFDLEGENSQWFTVRNTSNVVILEVSGIIPPAVIANNQKLIFVIRAQTPDGTDTRATVVISLSEEMTNDQVLGFDRLSYVGSIANNTVNLDPIVLAGGPHTGVTYTLHGQLANNLIVTSQGAIVTVALQGTIPEENIPSNRLIVLELQASAPQATPAYATIVLHVIVDDDTPPATTDLAFDATYYVGSYTANDGLVLNSPITLTEGYSSNVAFDLEGENSQWFTVRNTGNVVILEVSGIIPPAVIANNQKLIFVIRAQTPDGTDTRATVVISLSEEMTNDQVLGFDRLSYVGSIANNTVNLDPIVLAEGPHTGITYTLHGQLANNFIVTSQGPIVTVALQGTIPEESISPNRLIILELQASAPQATPAYATIVLHVIVDDDTPPATTDLAFDATYYVGSYTANDGLVLNSPITLTEGYSSNVAFDLEGENSQWFTVRNTGNVVILEVTGIIPPAVIANNRKLIFVIRAQTPDGTDTRATVVISLGEEMTNDQVLGFDRLSYAGSIANNTVNLDPIVLAEGPHTGVTYTLHGQLANNFIVTSEGAIVTVALQGTIPGESIPSNRLIILELQASAPQATPAYATIVLHVIVDDDTSPATTDLAFDATYYIGSYTANDGLVLNSPITLTEGYSSNVAFDLEGENAQWFTVRNTGNVVILEVTGIIPPAVIANNQKLIFVIRAQTPDGTDTRATVVISLSEEMTNDQMLGFDRLSYVGSIANNTVNLDPIVLAEGPHTGVTYTLHGQLPNNFIVTSQGPIVTVALQGTIPEENIPSNRLIILELQASAPQATPAYATIVLHVIVDDDTPPATTDLAFDATYYVGSYTANDGLVLNSPITLTEGYSSNVAFDLEGENSQWFSVRNTGNVVILEVSGIIPPAVIANNQKLIFVIRAQTPDGTDTRATVVISLSEEMTNDQVLGFDRLSYVGSIANNTVNLDPIVLAEGPHTGVTYTLHGQLANNFIVTSQGPIVTVALQGTIPEENIPSNRLIILELQASAPQATPAYATIVLHVIVDDDTPPATTDLAFDATYYVGSYTANDGLVLNSPITLTKGYSSNVAFDLEGENSQWFSVRNTGNVVILEVTGIIPPAVIANNQKLIFVIRAQTPDGTDTRATVVISLSEEMTNDQMLGFDRLSYVGSIANNTVNLDPIVLAEGPHTGVTYTLHGQLANNFIVTSQGPIVTVALQGTIPEENIPSNRLIILELQASAPQATPAYATIVLHVIVDDDTPPATTDLAFDATYYVGSYTANDGLVLNSPITLTEGYSSNVAFDLEGENSQWFTVRNTGNVVILEVSGIIPPAVIANNQKLIFIIRAQTPGGTDTRATVVISLSEEMTNNQVLGFDRLSYVGSIANNTVNLDPIVLAEGPHTGVTYSLHGQLANNFIVTSEGAIVTVAIQGTIPGESIPSNRLIVLELQASVQQARPAYAIIVLHVIVDDETTPATIDLAFDATYYVGRYSSIIGLIFEIPIVLIEGYDQNVVFTLEGDHVEWFDIVREGNSIRLETNNPIPSPIIDDNLKLIFVISAQRSGSRPARSTIVIILEQDDQISSAAFDKVLYEGIVQGGVVQHEGITVTGYNGTNVDITGAFASLFQATSTGGLVLVQAPGPLTLPDGTRLLVLELRAGDAGAVLILHINDTEEQTRPAVTFERAYVFSVTNRVTGTVGVVQATASNGEDVTYSLEVDSDHLRSRLFVASDGELRLLAPVDLGEYAFRVIATTVFTQASGNTTVQLTVEEVPEEPTICGNDSIVTAPLIIIDRDEEEAHRDLVSLNTTELPGCRYTLTNRWPVNQNWLYVDETGLHTTAVDREHPSIAYMALSQVQVELNLVCDEDSRRTKRSIDERPDWLGPYDYGNNKWVLTDSIPFNPRRSIVNLVVNDINDNYPIFIGKESEPIIVGYPISELEESVMPRSLAELQATDADIGVNAELLYWSMDPEIAVSPTTGFVHVRTGTWLEDNMMLTVNATDRNGEGLTGSVSLMVRLLDTENIAVITIRDAFLEDESHILGNISNSIGYEVRALRSIVVSASGDEETTRHKRDTVTTGTSLEVYVYGLIQTVPVAVERLSNDIHSAAIVTVDIASILSLEDHLEGNEICVIAGRDTGLLAATIVLSVLLFILIIVAAVWFFLTRKKQENYVNFSDANSLASQNESVVQPPKPEFVAKPRLNIEELKRSERRLHDMLNAPVEDVTIEPTPSSLVETSKDPIKTETKVPLQDPLAPIVIQDKLKDSEDTDEEDEFGERKRPRRKSVVTFNENVEKIIHVEDEPSTPESEIIADPNYEVYKF